MKKTLLLILALICVPAVLYPSHYFKDDFNVLSRSVWQSNFKISREGVYLSGGASMDFDTHIDPVSLDSGTGSLFIWGDTIGEPAYEGMWCGFAEKNLSGPYDASTDNPFGIKVNIFDIDTDNAYGNDPRDTQTICLWLAVENNITGTNEGESFDDYMIMTYKIGPDVGGVSYGQWGYAVGSQQYFNITNAIRADNITRIDLREFNQWNHETGDLNSGTDLTNYNVAISMQHDGNTIRFYLNPDPDDNNPLYPNEFCLIGEKNVAWNQNLIFLLGMEQKANGDDLKVKWDNVLVRSTADSSVPTMTTGSEVSASTNPSDRKDFELRFANSISSSNSGINVISITKPSSFGTWAEFNLTNEIAVLTAYEGGSTLKSNIIRPYYSFTNNNFSDFTNLGTNECVVKTNNGELWIRLGKQVDSGFVNREIRIQFRIAVSANEGTYTFDTAVEGILFEPVVNNQTNYSTCGKQRNSTTVDVSGDKAPYAFGSIEDDDSDNMIISGAPGYTFTYNIETIGITNADADTIKQVYIRIPEGFVVSSAESLVLVDDNDSCISFLTNVDIGVTNGNFIKVDYTLDTPAKKIAAQDGIDIVKIVVSEVTQIGTFGWPSWVVGSVSGDISKVKTNAFNLSQSITVIGANPAARAGIFEPSSGNPRILFNTMASNEIQIEIENTSTDPANRINTAIITVPSFFTNITDITSQRVSSANIKIYKAPLGNKSSITLIYANEGQSIPAFNQVDVITFYTFHSIPGNSGFQTNEYFSVAVNNSNGAGYVPVSTMGKVTNIMITDPQPFGAASIEPADGIVYTSDLTNTFTYQVINTAPLNSGINILFIEISIPTNYFTRVANIASSIVLSGITNINHKKILIDYTAEGTNLKPGMVDDITFVLEDKYTNIPAPDNVLIESKIFNFTKTNNTTDYLPRHRKVYFIPQEARVQSYVSNNWLLSEVTTSTLYYIFYNYGDPGNKVDYAEAVFSAGGISITKATSETSGLWGVAGLTFSKNNLGLDAGEKDVIKLIINDSIISEDTRDLISRVTVNTSILANTELPPGKTNRVFFQTPPPQASGKIMPNIMFFSSNKITNIFIYSVYNEGKGSNELEEAIIYIPGILQNKVSALSSSWLGGAAYITNKPDRIIISYIFASNTLNAGAFDNITLIVTNDLIFKTNLFWLLSTANNDGNPPTTNNIGTIINGSKYISVIEQPGAYINSDTDIYDSTGTNSFEYKFINPSAGEDIVRTRIYIPAIYTIITNTLSSLNKGAAVFSFVGNYIEIDYNANTLKPGENDVISFNIIDTINKTTNTSKWFSTVQYSTNDIFYSTSEDTGTQYLRIVLAPGAATIAVSPDIIYTTADTNTITVIVTNQGTGDNYITRVRLDYSEAEWVILAVDSSMITNPANEFWSSNYLYFKYDLEGKNIPVGTYDIISIQFLDYITNVCSRTLYCGVDNKDPGVDDYSASVNSEIIDFVFPAEAYIIPNDYSDPKNIDSTTYTNTYTYKINNQGKNSSIKQAIIKLPSIISNIISVNSSYMSFNTNIKWDSNITCITLNYFKDANGDLLTTANDTITMILNDSIESGSTNVLFESFVNDGNGYIKTMTTIDQSKSVGYYMPDAKAGAFIEPAQIYATSLSNIFSYIITNRGIKTDRILKARISIPSGFTQITGIHSSIISNDALYTSIIGNYIILDYQGDSRYIPAQTCDTITFTAFDNITSVTSFTWLSQVYNDPTNWQASDVPGGSPSKTQTVESRMPDYEAKAYIEPNQVESTVSTNHIFSVHIENTCQSDHNIVGAEIYIPLPEFTTNNILVSSSLISNIYITVLSDRIMLDYESAGAAVNPGNYDTVTLKIYDTLTEGWTNVTWHVKCAFDTSYGLYIDAGTNSGKSLDVALVMPDAHASAYIMPDRIFTASASNTFTYVITNKGSGTDRIKKARIFIPSVFTQITGINSSIISNDAVYVSISGNYIILDYQGDSRYIPSRTSDTITFTAYDNITSVTSYTWPSEVYNYATNWQVLDIVSPSKTQTINTILPDYVAEAYIEPNQIESTVTTNHIFVLKITNLSQSGNDIYRAEIYIPMPEFTTNNMYVSSSIISNTYITILSNRIRLDYQNAGTIIAPTNFDTITIKIYDTLADGWADVTWDVKCEFSSSFGQYIDAGTASGKSRDVAIVMPPARASAYIEPAYVYVFETNKTFIYKIINEGVVDNYITEAKIYVPSAIFPIIGPGYVQSTHISNDAAWAQYTGNVITLRYAQDDHGSLVSAQTDIITINVDISSTNETNNIYWQSKVTNNSGPSYPYTIVTPGKSQDVDIVEELSRAYAYIEPNAAYSTSLTNDFVYTISNGSALANNRIYYLKIFIPPIITNVYNIRSSVLSNTNNYAAVNWASNYILIDYAVGNTNIGKDKKDIITFTAEDNISYGTNMLFWDAKVDFLNMLGFRSTRTNSNHSKYVLLEMPNASARAYIEPGIIYTIDTDTTFTYTIINTGEVNNEITKVKIYVPDIFTNNLTPAKISSSHLFDTSPVYSDGVITIRYDLDSAGELCTGQTDVISIQAEDDCSFETNDVPWLSRVDNLLAGENYKYTTGASLQVVDILSEKGGAQFYTNNFNLVVTPEWDLYWPYGREGLTVDADLYYDTTFQVNPSSGELEMRGCPYTGHDLQNWIYNGFWTGQTMKLEKPFSATPENPFGFEILRTYSRLNPCAYIWAYERCQAELDIWLVHDTGTVNNHRDLYDGYMLLYEWSVMGYTNAPIESQKSYVGYYDGVAHDIDFQYSKDAVGNQINLTNNSIHSINYNYVWQTWRFWDGPNVPNPNHYGLKMEHDGTKISIYINPDPDDNDAYPNEYCLVAQKNVPWHDNMKILIGHENRNEDTIRQEAFYDYIRIISATAGTFISIEPPGVPVSPIPKSFTLALENEIGGTNAGVNYIEITKPQDLNWVSDPVNDIIVRNNYMGNATEYTLTTIRFDLAPGGNFPGPDEVAIRTNGDLITLILGTQISNYSDPEYEHIYVDFNFTLTNSSFDSDEFIVYLEARQFDAIPATWDKGSTCGLQKTLGHAVVSRTKAPAQGFSSIKPNSLIQGNESQNMTYYIGGGGTTVGNESIKQIAILIPGAFTVDVSSIDSFYLGNNTNYISIVNIPALTGSGEDMILMDYGAAGISIPAEGGLDIITFTIGGNVLEGIYQWKCWVDGDEADGNSLQTETNSSFNDQTLTIIPTPPITAGVITRPVNDDPVALFNTITINTLEFMIENRAPVWNTNNKIYTVVITIPGVFTNIVVLGSTNISTNNIKLHQGTNGNVSHVTLYYGRQGNPLKPDFDKDVFTFITYHNRPGNSGTTNVAFSAVVDNSNGAGFLPLSVTLITNMVIVDPYPVGSAYITPDSGIVYTSDITNDFTYKIFNSAPSGDILYSWIFIPTNYFTLIENIDSLRITAPWIRLTNNYTLFLDYSTEGGNNPIRPGEWDDITFTLVDKYTNIPVPDSVIITSKAGNITMTNVTIDKAPVLDLTRTVYFTPQEARVQSCVSNNLVRSEVTTSTLYYIFYNQGDPGNKIKYAEAVFSSGGLTITKATSETSGLWNIAGLSFSKNNLNIDGGQKEIVRLTVNDSIVSYETRDLIPSVTVNTSIMVIPGLPIAKENRVYFRPSSPEALGKISPNIMFISSNKITNILTYSIYNDGEGSNELEEVIIYIPDILANKVTGISSTWLGGPAYITNKSDRIIINYKSAGNTLDTKTTDIITLAVTNDLTLQTNLFWALAAANNDGNLPVTNNIGTIPAGSKYVTVVPQPNAYMSSSTNIYDSTRTNSFSYKFENPIAGADIIKARIYIPGIYTIVTNTLTSLNKGGTVSFTATNNYIEIDYSVNTLKSNESDEISFNIVDTLNKTTNTSKWVSEVQYFAYDIFYPTSEDVGTQHLKIILAPADAIITVLPDLLYTTAVTNTIFIVITNQGKGDNYITRLKVDYPETEWTLLSADSSIITNPANEYWFSGDIYFKYDPEARNIPARASDIITLQFTDSITAVCSKTLFSGVNNQYPGEDDYSTSAGDAVIDFAFPADAYVIPNNYTNSNNIDTTTGTNIYIYKINNSGKSSAIRKAVIYLPSVISDIKSVDSSYMFSNVNIAWDINITSITLNYYKDGNGNLSTLANDTITMVLIDNIEYGYTNAVFESLVDDGYGYVRTTTTASQSKSAGYYMPVPVVDAYIKPIEISTVAVSNTFTYIITNKGSGTDHILKARIFIPSGFTQISGIQSSIISNDAVHAFSPLGSNYIVLDYAGDGRSIPAKGSDTITFLAYDNIISENSYTWFSEVYNYPTNWQATGVFSTNSQTVISKTPGYRAQAFIEPNQIESTVITNHIFTVYITNTSAPAHDINRADIYIPLPEFTTNNISIASSTISNSYITIMSNRIRLDYQSAGFSIMPTNSDTITIRVYDTLNYGWADVTWDVKCEFNTSLGKYIDAGVDSGESKDVAVIMPDAIASAYIEPTSLYVAETNKTFIYRIINEGTGSNNITEAKIYVPVPLFAHIGPGYVQSTHISDDAAWAQASGGVITLRYAMDGNGSLTTGQTDTITIDVSVSVTEETNNVFWLSTVTNNQGPSYPYTTVTPGKFQDVDINELLAARAGIVPGNIYSTAITNSFTYTITNCSTDSSNMIFYAKIIIPYGVTNVYNIQSSILSTNSINVVWASNYILLDYFAETTNIGKYQKDVITFIAADNIASGYTNFKWDSQVSFSNTDSYIGTKTGKGHFQDVFLIMPDASASAYIEPEEISTAVKSNSFTYVISNKGYGTDYILRAKILIPSGFTIITNIQSSIINDDAIYAFKSNNYIMLDYKGDGRYISPQSSDTITFLAYDNITFEDSYIWLSKVYNYATNWQVTDIQGPSKTQTVESIIPGYTAKAHIEPNSIDSTVITNHIFTIPIENTGQSGNDIERAEIYIPIPEFTTNNMSVISSIISNSYITILSNKIRLDYQAAGKVITPANYDTIIIKIYDTLAKGWASVTWDVKCEFNTSFGQYIDTGTHFNRSKDVDINMPDAKACAYIEPTSIYIVETNKTFIYRIINEGTGNNNITEAKIYLPSSIFTFIGPGYVQSTHISNDSTWAVVSNGVITLKYAQDNYGSLLTGQTDVIMIDVSISAPGLTNHNRCISKLTSV